MATFANHPVASRYRGGDRAFANIRSSSMVVGDQNHDTGHATTTTERVARWVSQQRTLETEGLVMLDPEDQPGYRPASPEPPFLVDVDGPSGNSWDLGDVIVIDEPARGRYGQPRSLKRKVSYHGHRDENPGVPEPSGAALRQNMRAMLAGMSTMELPVRKRIRLPVQLPPNLSSNPNTISASQPGINTSSHPGINTSSHPGLSPLPLGNLFSHPSLHPVGTPSFNPVASTVANLGPGPGPVLSLPSSPTLSPTPTPAPLPVLLPALPPALPPAPARATDRSKNRIRGARKLRSLPAPEHTSTPGPRLEPVSEEIFEVANALPSEEVQIIEAIEAIEAIELVEPEGKCWFFILSAEIRDRIYRHLLVSQKPVHVKKLWTEQARSNARRSPRKRGAAPEKLFETDTDTLIDTRILRVCHQTAVEGTRILYSENKFLYILRDPPKDPLPSYSRGSRRSHRAAAAQSLLSGPASASGRAINFEKYCHLFRHMAVELELNRTGNEYEHLMVNALQALTMAAVDGSSSSPSSTDLGHGHLNTCPISLDTLTITITPVLQPVLQPKSRKGREASVADFFSQSSLALQALKRINTRSIRVNVHVAQPRSEDDDSDEDDDLVNLPDDYGDIDNADVVRRKDGNKRQLETTIDMRFCPRHMNQANVTYIRNPFYNEFFPDDPNVPQLIKVYPDELWECDPHILAKRSMMGQRAEAALEDLRERILAACKDPNKAVREGLWEDHEVAEQRRRVLRAKHQNKFDVDALLFMKRKKSGRKEKKKAAKGKGKGKEVARDSDDDEDHDMEFDDLSRTNSRGSESGGDDDNSEDGDGESSDDEGGEPYFSSMKSLICSISKVGNEALRAHRA